MKAPQFWKKNNLIAYSLLPFSFLYQVATFIINFTTNPKKISRPVICIGNLIAGGSGKTPIAIAIGSILKEMNCDFAYLSRGYGGKIKDLTLVNHKLHNALEVGDEALLLAEIYTSFIARNRALAAEKIVTSTDKKLIIMDDGLQNPSLYKDFSILVIDGIYGFGNSFIMPAGPLRERVSQGIKKADLIIIIGEDKFNIAKLCANKKIIFAKIIINNNQQFRNAKLIAFCGIGRPDKFFSSLKEINCDLIKTISYADHHLYKNSDLEYLLSLAKSNNSLLITTKKDWVRLAEKYRQQINYLDITIKFDDENYLKTQLFKLINND